MLGLKKDNQPLLTVLPSLESLKEYTNRHVLERYKKDHPDNKMPAEQAFEEIKKYFWLGQKHRIDRENSPDNEALKFECSVHFEMKEIDDMWHTFILFTIDYMRFCEEYFGEFIHHLPNTDDEEQLDDAAFAEDLTKYLSYIYDELGEETVRTWFAPLLEEQEHHDSEQVTQHNHEHEAHAAV